MCVGWGVLLRVEMEVADEDEPGFLFFLYVL